MPRVPIDRSVSAVDRALSILQAFVKGGGKVQTLDDLERETGLFKSVICRYLLSFERNDYVTKISEGRYQLGSAVLRLGRTYEKSFDISQHVMPILERLSKTTSESASYYIRDNQRRVCLYRVDSPYSLRVYVQPGRFMPMDKSATAQVLRDFYPGLNLAGPPSAWIRTSVNLLPEHYSSMSAPVFGLHGYLAGALTVSGPSSRFDTSRNTAARKALLMAARSLSLKLGVPPLTLTRSSLLKLHKTKRSE